MPQTAFAAALDDLIAGLEPDRDAAMRHAEAIAAGSQKAAMEDRLTSFIAHAWASVDATPFAPTWHIGAVAEHLQALHAGQIKRLIINQPPGTAKSLVTSVLFPAWVWGPTNRADTRFVVVSHAGQHTAPAVRDGVRARRLMESPWYQSRWPDRFQFAGDQNTKGFYENDRHGYRVSSGPGATAGHRADILILDDVLKLTDRLSPTALKKFRDDWPSLSSRLSGEDAKIILIMQRLNVDDPTGFFLERQKEEGWVIVRLPRLFEPEHRCVTVLPGRDIPFFRDPRSHEGEPLTNDGPAFRSLADVLNERIRVGEFVFAGQEQQRPSPLKGGMIQLAWLRRWSLDPTEGQLRRPAVFDQIIQSWDMAFKSGSENSWVVGQVWGLKDAYAFLLDQARGHWDFPMTIREVVKLCEAWPGTGAKLVEDKANGPAIISTLQHAIPGLIPVEVKDSKVARMAAVAPFFESGNVFVPEDTAFDWVSEYVSELVTWPKSRALDQGDATSQAIWRLLGSLAASEAGNKFGEYNALATRTPIASAPPVVMGGGITPGAGAVFSGGFALGAIERALGRR